MDIEQTENCWLDADKTLHLTCERCGKEDEWLFEAPDDPQGVHDHDPFWTYETDWFYGQRPTAWLYKSPQAVVICSGCLTPEERHEREELCPSCGADKDCDWVVKAWRGAIMVCDACASQFPDRIESFEVHNVKLKGDQMPTWLEPLQ